MQRYRDGFCSCESDVAVFVVMDVYVYCSGEGRGGWGEGVDRAPSAVPEVVG